LDSSRYRSEHGFVYIFLHIPKTGGTTLYNLAAAALPPAFLLNDRASMAEFLQIPQAERDAIRFIYGHIPPGAHRFLTRPARYITFLREPIDRVVSAYCHCRRTPEHPLNRPIHDGMTLIEFTRYWGNNRQTRQLGAYWLDREFSDEEYVDRLTSYLLSPRNLRNAKELVDRCFFVGLHERFDADLRDLFAHIGLRLPATIPQFLKFDDRPSVDELSPEVIATIAAYNRFDIELYGYARERQSLEATQVAQLQSN
jgi:hypothetical protein